ncbi:tigger transposable element-derived protein 4-like [Latimeria chalumnae]|uniref:tigger transposable element-derived protein 4-like n=1 Tax=Latimeria chalumnae TaxID=7897 RepID=UPI0003C13A33|nr:PREDICTED: tigger transposable element-derived protein 4-like [Latimeria chalumnae]|eukprot:XP_006002184.1 PREDICTED: tigger transposable element-derived protein 4-like [Latimeria chalumnae]
MLSIGTKANAIREVLNGESKAVVAKKFNVPRMTLNSWLENKGKILDSIDADTFSVNQKRMWTSTHSDIENCLLAWLRQARAQSILVSGPILTEKANQFAAQLGVENFECTNGWLEHFKARHGISSRLVCGEANSAPQLLINEWKSMTLVAILAQYELRDIYNADKTGLFWQLLLNRTLAFKGEKCSSGKQSKQRFTVLLAANNDGSDKRKLLVTGKSAKPCCFNGIQINRLPVQYMANKKVWMVSTIFEEYVRALDHDMVQQKRKVVFIVDNCPAHPHLTGLKAVCLQLLPPNTTSHTQPLDSGVIRNFKVHYHHDLAMHTLIAADSGNTFKPDVLMSITIMKKAWDLVEKETIAKCFCHCGFTCEQPAGEDNVLEEESELEESSHFNNTVDQLHIIGLWPMNVSQDDFIDVDAVVIVSELTSDSDIVAAQSMIDKPDHDDDAEEDENDNDTDIRYLRLKSQLALQQLTCCSYFWCNRASMMLHTSLATFLRFLPVLFPLRHDKRISQSIFPKSEIEL